MKRPLCNDYLTFLNVRARHSPGLTFNSDCRLGEDDDSSSSSESLAAAAEEESYLDKLNARCESTPFTPYATTPSRDAPAHAENISDARPLHSRGVCAGLENGGDPASGGEGLENARSDSVAPLGNCTGAACGDATLQCDKPLAPAICGRRESRNLTGLDGLCLGKQLGVGAFGTVNECQWRDKKFAVKQFRADRMGKENARREIQVLKHIGKSVRCPGVFPAPVLAAKTYRGAPPFLCAVRKRSSQVSSRVQRRWRTGVCSAGHAHRCIYVRGSSLPARCSRYSQGPEAL